MKFFKKHKKGLITLIVVAALATGVVIWFKSAYKKGMEMLTNAATTEVAVSERRDLVSVISATGKVTSLSSFDATSIATGAKILEVKVSVGDMVNEGDTLVVLDSSDIEKNIASTKESLDTAQKSSDLSVSSAQRRYNETKTSADVALAKIDEQIAEAEKKIKDLQPEIDYYAGEYRAAIKRKEEWEATYKTASAAFATAQASYDKAVADDDASEKARWLAELDNLNKTYNLAMISTKVMEESTSSQYWLGIHDTKFTQKTQYESTVESLKKTRDDTVRTNEASLAASKDTVNSAKYQSEGATATYDKQIETLEKQLEACIITAPASGIVTSVNVKEGASYTGVTAVVIEDTSAYEITTEIDEYDIGKVKVGQKVVIKTNGTGDEELEGVVKSVAPRATTSMTGVSQGAVTYKVVISLLTKNDMIKLDMTAKLSIVLSKAENALVVPLDAVITDEEGKEYVNVIDGKDENGANITHRVDVETGIKTDYYAEIIGDSIKDGQEVEVKREASQGFDFSTIIGGNATSGM